MTTGDVKGVLRKLEQRLRTINYPRDVDYPGLVKGEAAASLPIISYTFTGYSTHIAEILVSFDVELSAKSDLRFIDAVYKVLRDIFHFKPILTKQQFLQCAFAERKIQTVCDIIDCVVKKHKEMASHSKDTPNTSVDVFILECHLVFAQASASFLISALRPFESIFNCDLDKLLCPVELIWSPLPADEIVLLGENSAIFTSNSLMENISRGPQTVKKCSQITSSARLAVNFMAHVKSQPVKKMSSSKCEVFYQEGSSFQPAASDTITQKRKLVERHAGSESPTLPVVSEIFTSPNQEEVSSSESEAECTYGDVVTKDAQIELLKAQLAECQEKLTRLEWMEDRLQALENSMKGKIIIETDWNNLLSRVLLLETDRLLQSRKKDLPSEFPANSEERMSSRIRNKTSPDCNSKPAIPESHHHQSSGYNCSLSADTSRITSDIHYSGVTEDSNETTKQRMDRLAKMLEETSKLLKYSNTS
ncbi:centrosomal protein of 44 kDa [Gastrophryne carolinensis]